MSTITEPAPVAPPRPATTRMGRLSGPKRWDTIRSKLLGLWAGLALLYLFLPIFIVILFSFNDNKGRFNVTWQGFTLDHWKDPFSVPGLGDAMTKSIEIAVISTVIAVLLGTGTLMFWTGLARLAWRTGATFVHDWFALGLGLLVLGHIYFAMADPEAREGMRTGRVRRSWAQKEHSAWARSIDEPGPGAS